MKAPSARRGRPKVQGLAERRRDEILSAATRVFAREGYACADLQDVADAIGVGKGTLYRYFDTKEQMFQAAVDRVMASLHAEIDGKIEGKLDALDRISTAIRTFLTFVDAHPEYIELLIQERANFKDRKKPTYFEHRDRNIGPWQEMYRKLIADGRVRDVPVDRITDAMTSQLYGRVFTNYFVGRAKPLTQQADDLLDVIWNGILTPTERQAHSTDHEERR
jgi:AcrR family transcriptional regulator